MSQATQELIVTLNEEELELFLLLWDEVSRVTAQNHFIEHEGMTQTEAEQRVIYRSTQFEVDDQGHLQLCGIQVGVKTKESIER